MIKKALFILSVIVSIAINAQEIGFTKLNGVEDFVSKAKEISDKTNTIDSDFIQEKYLDVLEELIISEGHFNFKKENLIRWEYQKPFKYLVIINNGKIFIKDENKENKFDMKSNKMFKNINEMIVKSVQGDIHEDENFNVTFYENNTQILVQLQPKDESMKEFMNKINIYFSKSDYSVERVKMIELSEDYTSIKFINRKINVPLADEKFSTN